jgi:hypothetical protein
MPHYWDLWQFLTYHWNWATLLLISLLVGVGWHAAKD